MPPCSGQSRPSPAGGREDAASLDRPCARRLRDLAGGVGEYSRRGAKKRMRPKRAKKTTFSNRWFSGNFRLALTFFERIIRRGCSCQENFFVGERHARGCQQRLSGGEHDRARAGISAGPAAKTRHQASGSDALKPWD